MSSTDRNQTAPASVGTGHICTASHVPDKLGYSDTKLNKSAQSTSVV